MVSKLFFLMHRMIASKVFEDRLINKGLIAEFRDFEAVYHLVIDAVDTYNEQWEQTFRDQQQQQQVMSRRTLLLEIDSEYPTVARNAEQSR